MQPFTAPPLLLMLCDMLPGFSFCGARQPMADLAVA
jgi:hypothetical protein